MAGRQRAVLGDAVGRHLLVARDGGAPGTVRRSFGQGYEARLGGRRAAAPGIRQEVDPSALDDESRVPPQDVHGQSLGEDAGPQGMRRAADGRAEEVRAVHARARMTHADTPVALQWRRQQPPPPAETGRTQMAVR